MYVYHYTLRCGEIDETNKSNIKITGMKNLSRDNPVAFVGRKYSNM